jgi:hypothetical protein
MHRTGVHHACLVRCGCDGRSGLPVRHVSGKKKTRSQKYTDAEFRGRGSWSGCSGGSFLQVLPAVGGYANRHPKPPELAREGCVPSLARSVCAICPYRPVVRTCWCRAPPR